MICNHRHPIGLILALFTVSYGLSPVLAQQGERLYEHANSRFDVDFPGGALSEYVDALRKARPNGAANVIVMPAAQDLQVPPIKLVAVTVEAAIQILEGHYTTVDGLTAEVDVRTYDIGDSPDLVMKILAQTERRFIRSAVWSVEEALAYGQTAEQLLEAVEAARSLFPTKAEISYHPPTGLLIARGTDEQLDLVRDLLDQLINGAQRRSMEMDSIRRDIDEYEADRFRMDAEMQIAQKETQVARAYLDQMTQRMQLGKVSQEEVARADLDHTRVETQFTMREHERRRIVARLKTLHDAMKRYESKRE